MFWTILSYLLVAVVGFVVGALVFRNNPVKGEAAVDLLDSKLKDAQSKIEDLKNQIKNR